MAPILASKEQSSDYIACKNIERSTQHQWGLTKKLSMIESDLVCKLSCLKGEDKTAILSNIKHVNSD